MVSHFPCYLCISKLSSRLFNLSVDLDPYRDPPLIFATDYKLQISIADCFLTQPSPSSHLEPGPRQLSPLGLPALPGQLYLIVVSIDIITNIINPF